MEISRNQVQLENKGMISRVSSRTPKTKLCTCGWPMNRIVRRQNGGGIVFFLLCTNRSCKRQEPI